MMKWVDGCCLSEALSKLFRRSCRHCNDKHEEIETHLDKK